jgi:DNA topoisomerase-1
MDILIKRGYASGSSLELSELGFAIVEAMSEYSPTILSVEMTRTIESELEGIEAAALDPDTVTTMGVERLLSCLRLLEKNRTDLGLVVYRASAQTAKTRASLGSCPICNRGELMVIHSRKTGKRFVGCSNYKGGCRASAPLPQKGTIRATKYPCKKCGWPIILVFMAYGRRPWRLCVNPTCPAKLAFEQKATEGKPAN